MLFKRDRKLRRIPVKRLKRSLQENIFEKAAQRSVIVEIDNKESINDLQLRSRYAKFVYCKCITGRRHRDREPSRFPVKQLSRGLHKSRHMRKFVRKYVKKNVPKSSVIPVRRGLQHGEGISLFLTCPRLPVILESDTSQYGIGAVILHRFPNGDERPIAYASRSLNSSGKNYSQIEKEGLAIIFGVTKYYMYLFSSNFKLITNPC